MRKYVAIWLPFLALFLSKSSSAHEIDQRFTFDFFGEPVSFVYNMESRVDFNAALSDESIATFYQSVQQTPYESILKALAAYKAKNQPDDWLFYQLIRKCAQQISQKAENYHRYTLYKWLFLVGTGYDATLSYAGDKLLFYVKSTDNIYNIPFRMRDGNQYVCLNYHDYGYIDFNNTLFKEINLRIPSAQKSFCYKITQLPTFSQEAYQERDIQFTYANEQQHLKVMLNPEVRSIFTNYPIVDYNYHFNIPLSSKTYQSLIPDLKKHTSGMSVLKGVDYLMHLTRNAFIFEKDTKTFGKEKRMSPEETLLYEQSDCEDRAALFFYLVKEIYDLPMIVVVYANHVTVAVKLDKPVGKTIEYMGMKYTICEPTPQRFDLKVGQISPKLKKANYEIAYHYSPYIK